MFTEIRSSWKIRGLNPVFVCWQGDAGKRGTWAFLPKDGLLSPAPNAAWSFPKLLLALLHSSVSCWWDALWDRHSSFLLGSLCGWDGEGADMVRAEPLPKSLYVVPLLSSYATFLWRISGLQRQSWFEGCDTFVGWAIRVFVLYVAEPSGEMFLLQHDEISAECW